MTGIDALGLPPERWVDVDGPVHYREWPGRDGEPTFVLVHGLGGSLLNWAPVAPGLAERGRVIALDLAGFGRTPVAGRGVGVGPNWKLVDGFLHALGLGRVILIGNSMGGMLALIQAAHDPSSAERLILVDAAFPRPRDLRAQPHPRVIAAFAWFATGRLGAGTASLRARRLGAEGLVRQTLALCAADPSSIDPRLVAALVEQSRWRLAQPYATEAFLAAARTIFRVQVAPTRYRSLVRAVRAPTLVIHGARDRLVPVATARAAARAHHNWELEVFPDLGHVPQMEAPGRWLEAVHRWLDRGQTEAHVPAGRAPGHGR